MIIKNKWVQIILFFLSLLLVSKWFIELGFRVNFFDVLIIAFIVIAGISYGINYPYNKKNQLFIVYIWGYFLIATLSGIFIALAPLGLDAYNFYFKGIFQLFIYSIFLTQILLILPTVPDKIFQRIIDYYLLGVFLSIAYSFLQILLKIKYRIDIDDLISNSLPFVNKVEVSRYDYGNFFRINGLAADPNIHASYCLSALPLIIVRYFNNHKKRYAFGIGLILFSIVLSMSLSAMIGVAVVLILTSIFYAKRIKQSLFLILPILAIGFWFYHLFKVDIDLFLAAKLSSKGTTSYHLLIAINSIKVFLNHPFGVGYNNFSIAYGATYGEMGWNPHNSWLTYLVELGLIGLFFKIILFILLFRISIIKKSQTGKVFAITLAGLSFAALGYESLNLFYSQYWIAILFIYMIRESIKNDEKNIEYN